MEIYTLLVKSNWNFHAVELVTERYMSHTRTCLNEYISTENGYSNIIRCVLYWWQKGSDILIIIKTVDKPMDHTAYVQSHHSDESQKNTIFSVLFSFYFHCLFFVVCLLVGFMYTNIMKYAFIILIHPSNTHINVNNNIVWTMNVGCLIDFFNLNCFSVVFCLLFSTSHPTTKPFGLNSSQLPDLNIQKCPVISFIYFNIFLFCFTFGMASKVVNMVSVSLYSLLLFWILFFFLIILFSLHLRVQLE